MLESKLEEIAIDLLQPHPDNPRLFIRPDIKAAIACGIKANGFRPEYALLVRKVEEGYQIISGHSRVAISREIGGIENLPCWVREMTDEEAFFELVRANSQGELTPLEIGLHALKAVNRGNGGQGKKAGISEYARAVGKGQSTISELRSAAEVFNKLIGCPIGLLEKAHHLAAISKAPEIYWETLAGLLLEKGWTVKETEAAIEVIKAVEIPEILHDWLNPKEWADKAISDYLSDPKSDTHTRVSRWAATALKVHDELDSDRPTWHFTEEGEPIRKTLNLRTIFLGRLNDIKMPPSDKKISDLASKILKEVKGLDAKYEDWLKLQSTSEENRKIKEEANLRILELREKYSPVGLCGDLRDFNTDLFPSNVDAIVTDPPYRLSNGGITVRSGKQASVNKNFADSENDAICPELWMPLAADLLKDGGYLVFTCTNHILAACLSVAATCGLELHQKLIWYKRSAPPLLSADRFQMDYEDILVFKKGDATSYFGYDDVKISDRQRGSIIDIPQCAGNERMGWHDTQKPLELYELLVKAYVPVDGIIFEPFAGTGTTAVAAKRLQRRCVWVEADEEFFLKSESRIEASPFCWEIDPNV